MIFYKSEYLNLNDVCISFKDRSFNYGDGFFESIKIINSKPINFPAHYSRIIESCEILLLNSSYSYKDILNIIEKLIFENHIVDGFVKLHFGRNSEGRYLPESHNVSLMMISSSGERYKINNSISICTYSEELKTKGRLSNIKSCSSLVSVLSSIYAKNKQFDNAILFNTDSNIIECSNSNIFIVKNNFIYTPPISDGCVNGTMRSWVMQNFKVIEQSLSSFDITNADEFFISNAINGITSVNRINNKTFESSESSFKIQTQLINMFGY